MFGWGRKKPPKPVVETRTVRLDDAPAVAGDARARREESAVLEASNALHRANSSSRELAKIRRDIERDKVAIEEVDKRLRPLAARGKKMLLEALRNNSAEIAPIRNYDDMVRAGGELEHRLKKMGNILGKQAKIMHTFAEKHSARLKQILEDMDRDCAVIKKRVIQHQADTASALGVTEGVRSIRMLEDSVRENCARGGELHSKRDEILLDMSRASGAIDAFAASEEYGRLRGLHDALERSRADRDSLTSLVAAQFTKISRPLDRYVHVSADKAQSALLRRVLRDPYSVMTERDGDDVVALLEGVRKAVSAGSISVKDTGKAAAAIIQTQEAIPDFVDRAHAAGVRIRDIQGRIRESDPERMDRLRAKLESLKTDLGDAERRMDDSKNAARAAAASIPPEMAKIQESLYRLTGTRFSLAYTVPKM